MVRGSERLHTGHIISGVAHLGIIGWVLVGGVFRPDPPPLEVTEVAVISSAAFDRLTAPPATVTDVALPTPPVELDAPTGAAEPEPVVPVARPEETAQPEPEAVPVPPEPEPDPELTDETVALTQPEVPDVPVPEVSERPVPRQAERIAPEAVEAPEIESAPDPVEQAAVTPDPAPAEETPPVEEQEQTAPEEAATEITTEAETPSSAPKVSARPPARRPSPPVVEPEPEPEEVQQAAQPEPEPETDTSDAINDALAEALGGGEDTRPDVPVGPPMTSGEEQGFLRQVRSCWNVGSLSTAAMQTIVTIGFSMGEDGKPVSGSLKMIRYEGGNDASARQAYEAGRRAILRCAGGSGYDMPAEKYAHWRDIELTFDPNKMRLK